MPHGCEPPGALSAGRLSRLLHEVDMVDPRRITALNSRPRGTGPVIYWMSRDQRVKDNWALLFARQLAGEGGAPLLVAFCLTGGFLGAIGRQYRFMLDGLEQVERDLAAKGIGFFLLEGDPVETVPGFARRVKAGAVVCDFDPLRVKMRWKAGVARALDVAFYEVDAHNVVPCRAASSKQEYAAFTIRPRLQRALGEFLEVYPPLMKPGAQAEALVEGRVDWQELGQRFAGGEGAGVFKPGERAAHGALGEFLESRLEKYPELSNDPNAGADSGLSPYLHFGQLSAQRVALEVMSADAPPTSKEAFLEQLIVRRELSDNFCLHNRHYDSVKGFPEWALKTLDAHRGDPREYLYGFRQFEGARTHDELWNAAQTEMVTTGKMHGYMRMYWAKKILEWTRSPEDAMRIALELNDRYELDGRDPNGYVGVAWSLGGVHDRAWRERAVFGTIRYMSLAGCRRKFDVDRYVNRVGNQASRGGGGGGPSR